MNWRGRAGTVIAVSEPKEAEQPEAESRAKRNLELRWLNSRERGCGSLQANLKPRSSGKNQASVCCLPGFLQATTLPSFFYFVKSSIII